MISAVSIRGKKKEESQNAVSNAALAFSRHRDLGKCVYVCGRKEYLFV